MKTFKQFITEAQKDRVIGTFKDASGAKVVVVKARGPTGPQLNVAIKADDNTKPRVIVRAINRTNGNNFKPNEMKDKDIVKALQAGSWASTFKQAGGVNWVK